MDNADLSQLSDYAAEVFYQFLLKVIKESSLFWGVTKTKTPKFTIQFVQKFGGKNRTEDNLAD